MSLLFDQNLSRRLPALLGAIFPGSRQVIGAGLIGAEDELVWEYAALHGLAIDLVNCKEYLVAAAAEQLDYLKRHLIEASLAAYRAMLPPEV